MSSTIDLITASLRADADTLRIVSQNIANAQSVAYLREIPLNHIPVARGAHGAQAIGTNRMDEFARTLESGNATIPGNVLDAGDVLVSAAGAALDAGEVASALDLRPGTLRSTANPLHLALESQGFFVVQTSQGTMFTRRGDFRLDSEGRLVTQAGDPVQGGTGDINAGRAGQPAIAPDGTVRVDTDVVGKLRIVQVGNATALQAQGNGLYSLASGEETTEATAPLVHQGFLETSNVQTVNEIIQLMEAMRRFESAQRFVRGYDDMMDKTISTLGRI